MSHYRNLRKRKEAAWEQLGALGWPEDVGEAFGIPIAGGLVYLLYDQFTTDRAAGAVNGTPAEPTGQTRTVTDTNSKLTIASGKLSFATGGVGDGNPGLWYPQEARVLGKIILFQMNLTANNFFAGLYTAQSGAVNDGVRLVGATTLQVRDNANPFTIGAFTASTDYTFILIYRAAGFYLFVKGGGFTTFTLLWYSAAGAGNQYPGYGASGTTTVGLGDDIRIPQATYIPLPLAFDSFTRANGVLGSTEAASADAQAIAALTWLFTAGIWAVATNKAVGTPVPGADVIINGGFATDTDWTKGAGWTIAAGLATVTAGSLAITEAVGTATRWYRATFTITAHTAGTLLAQFGTSFGVSRAALGTFTGTNFADTSTLGIRALSNVTASIDDVIFLPLATAELFASVLVSTADVIASVAITLSGANSGFQAGLVLNLDSTSNPQNYILCYLNGNGSLLLYDVVAGVYTNKIATSITYSAGALLYVIRDGTSCRVFYNFAAVGTVQTMSVNTATNHGLFSTDASNSLDTFNVYARGKNNEYAALDAYV